MNRHFRIAELNASDFLEVLDRIWDKTLTCTAEQGEQVAIRRLATYDQGNKVYDKALFCIT